MTRICFCGFCSEAEAAAADSEDKRIKIYFLPSDLFFTQTGNEKRVERERDKKEIGSGDGLDGRSVDSDIRDPWFESR